MYFKGILTHHSILSKKDVESGKVLLPSIVGNRLLLGVGLRNLLQFIHLRWQLDKRVKVFVSLWAGKALDVVGKDGVACLVVNLFNLKRNS